MSEFVASGDEVVFSVLDRGPGIAQAEAEIIFQAFYRSDRTSTKASGAGIGLAVCKLLVQAQSGRIWARPRRGGGSVFSFTLPAGSIRRHSPTISGINQPPHREALSIGTWPGDAQAGRTVTVGRAPSSAVSRRLTMPPS